MMDYVYDGYLDVMMIGVEDYSEKERKVMVESIIPSFRMDGDDLLVGFNQYDDWLNHMFTYNEQEKVRHALYGAFKSFSFDGIDELSFDKDLFVTLFVGALQLFGSKHLTKHILGAYGGVFQHMFLNKEMK